MTTDHLTPEQKAKASLCHVNPYGTFRLDMDGRLDLDRGPAEGLDGREPGL